MQSMRFKGQASDTIRVIGYILLGIAFLVGLSFLMYNSFAVNPQAKAIVIAQTATSAANSLSMAEKGEFIITLEKPADIEIYRNTDGIYMFKIFYEGPFESILSSGESRNIEPVGLDKINMDESAFEGGSYETPFLCSVNEIKAAGVNMIYVSKLPGEDFVRVSNFRSDTVGGVSI
jgi:hypothetical protein